MTIEILSSEYDLIGRIARKIAQRYSGYAEYDDIYQECASWICENYEQVLRWREEPDGIRPLATALKRRGGNYARREQAAWKRSLTPRQVAEDYTAKQVRAALPFILTELDVPGTLPQAILTDIKRGYERLSWQDQGVIRAAVVYDYDYEEIARVYTDSDVKLTPAAARMRVSRSIKRLAKAIHEPNDEEFSRLQWKTVPRRSTTQIIRLQAQAGADSRQSNTNDTRDDLH